MTKSAQSHPVQTPAANGQPDPATADGIRPERRIALLESRIEALEQELNAVYASRSWKITRPLRGLAFATAGRLRRVLESFRKTEKASLADSPRHDSFPAEEPAPPSSAKPTALPGPAVYKPVDERYLGNEAREIYRKIKDALSKHR